MSLPLFPFFMRRVTGSYIGTLREMHALMALVKAGKVAPIPTESRPLDQASQALDDLVAGKVVGRVVLKREAPNDAGPQPACRK